MQLIFKSGTIFQKLYKCSKLENLRLYIQFSIEKGAVFSDKSMKALSKFPKSEIRVYFALIHDDEINSLSIKKFVLPNESSKLSFRTAGFSFAQFINNQIDENHINNEHVCYHIPYEFCEKINWIDAEQVPSFITDVFMQLDCMPDEIIN